MAKLKTNPLDALIDIGLGFVSKALTGLFGKTPTVQKLEALQSQADILRTNEKKLDNQIKIAAIAFIAIAAFVVVMILKRRRK